MRGRGEGVGVRGRGDALYGVQVRGERPPPATQSQVIDGERIGG